MSRTPGRPGADAHLRRPPTVSATRPKESRLDLQPMSDSIVKEPRPACMAADEARACVGGRRPASAIVCGVFAS
jgi:hypothetical protein